MNAKQAARAAAKHIEELEHQVRLNVRDIKLYVQCIQHMIQRGSPCDYCEDRDECLADGKNVDTGCDDWMLKLWKVTEPLPGRPDGTIYVKEEREDGDADGTA